MSKILKFVAVSILAVQASVAMADTKSQPIVKSTQSVPVVAAAGSISGSAIVLGLTVLLFTVGASSGSHGSNFTN